MEIYLCIPQGSKITDGATKELGVESEIRLTLRLVKSLYGIKQAGRIWSRLLHDKLKEAGFTRCITDMCVYFKSFECDITVVGACVDHLLVAVPSPRWYRNFSVKGTLSI